MERQLSGFEAVLFITGTFTTSKSWDDIAIATRRFALYLCRLLKAHLSVEIGVETGANSHFHMTVFSPDLRITDAAIRLLESQKAWGFGRIEVQRWKPDMAGRHYVLKHQVVHMAGEVFCPCQKKVCRKNRCPHQLRQRGGDTAGR